MIERPQAYDSEDEETLVDRSVSFVREMSARLRDHASRRWRVTSLSVDIGILRRRRRQWLLALGDGVYARLRRGQALEARDLQDYVEELRNIEQEIAAKEQQVAEIDEDERFEQGEDERMLAPVVPSRERGRRPRRRDGGEPRLPPSGAARARPQREAGEHGDEEEAPPGVG